jgi:hypothetical protein
VIVLFTIGTSERKARELNPHSRREPALAERSGEPISGYLPRAVDPPGVEPGPPPRQGGALPLGDEPARRPPDPSQVRPDAVSGPPGSRTPISWLQARRLPVGPVALHSSCIPGVRPRIELGPPPYQGGMPPSHPRTIARIGRQKVRPRVELGPPLYKRGMRPAHPRTIVPILEQTSRPGGNRTPVSSL